MTGIRLTGSQRSQLLQRLLADAGRQREPQVQSLPQLAAELGTAYLEKKRIDKLAEEERMSQQAIIDALNTQAQPATAASQMQMESVPGTEGMGSITIPGKREVSQRGMADDAIRNLPTIGQQAQARELQMINKEANARTPDEASDLDWQRQQKAQETEYRFMDEQQQKRIDAQARQAEADRRNRLTMQEREAEMRENEQIRDIQSKFALLGKENEYKVKEIQETAKSKGIDLTERQGKATAWLNSAGAGNEIVEQKLAAGYHPSEKDQYIFAAAIDEETGAVSRRVLRNKGMSQEGINFFESAYFMVDAAVRQATGAAVREFEFINWTNALVPFSEDPQENAQKSFMRKRVLAGFAAEAGPGGVSLYEGIANSLPTPDFQPLSKDNLKAIGQGYGVDESAVDPDILALKEKWTNPGGD